MKKIKELTPEEFAATYSDSMRLLSEDDTTCEHIKVKPAVSQCIEDLKLEIDLDDIEIHYAYLNEEDDYCHIGFNWGFDNIYLVLIVQPAANSIAGYVVLDTDKANLKK